MSAQRVQEVPEDDVPPPPADEDLAAAEDELPSSQDVYDEFEAVTKKEFSDEEKKTVQANHDKANRTRKAKTPFNMEEKEQPRNRARHRTNSWFNLNSARRYYLETGDENTATIVQAAVAAQNPARRRLVSAGLKVIKPNALSSKTDRVNEMAEVVADTGQDARTFATEVRSTCKTRVREKLRDSITKVVEGKRTAAERLQAAQMAFPSLEEVATNLRFRGLPNLKIHPALLGPLYLQECREAIGDGALTMGHLFPAEGLATEVQRLTAENAELKISRDTLAEENKRLEKSLVDTSEALTLATGMHKALEMVLAARLQ